MKKGLERTASTGAIAHLGIQWGEAWCSPRQKCFAFLVFCIMSYSCLQLFPPFGKMLRAFCVYTTLIYHSSSSAPFKKTAKIEWIIVQEDFRVGKNHEQLVFLCPRAVFAFIQ